MEIKVVARDSGSPLPHPYAYQIGSNTIGPLLGCREGLWVYDFRNRVVLMAGEVGAFLEQSHIVLEKLQDPAFVAQVDRESRRTVRALEEYAAGLSKRDFARASGEELASALEKLIGIWTDMDRWGHIVNASDFEHFLLTATINKMLEARIREGGLKLNVSEAFVTLTTPLEKSLLQQQEEDFFKLLSTVQANSRMAVLFQQSEEEVLRGLEKFPALREAIERHVREYDWLEFHYDGPKLYDKRYYTDLLASEVRQGVNGAQKLEELAEKRREIEKQQRELTGKLKLTPQDQQWIRAAKLFAFLKLMRKDIVFKASARSDPLFVEIAKRLGLDRYQVRHLAPEEIREGLLKGTPLAKLAEERVRYCVMVAENGKVRLLTGKEAEEYSKQLVEEKPPETSELKGQPARPGQATGVVRIITAAEDMPKMRAGDILVSHATNPDLVPAMKKAAAILTDEGGITCHAAIVSRELGIPCVVGLRTVTRWVKDGDKVEVDATNGIVRKQ